MHPCAQISMADSSRQETSRTGIQGGVCRRHVATLTKYQDARSTAIGGQQSRHRQVGVLRQPECKDQEIWPALPAGDHGVGAIFSLSDNLESGIMRQHAYDPFANYAEVGSYNYSARHG